MNNNKRFLPIKPRVKFPDLVLCQNGEIRCLVNKEAYQNSRIQIDQGKPPSRFKLAFFEGGSAFHKVNSVHHNSNINIGLFNSNVKFDNPRGKLFNDFKLTPNPCFKPFSHTKPENRPIMGGIQEEAVVKPIWRGWESPKEQRFSDSGIFHPHWEASRSSFESACSPISQKSSELTQPAAERKPVPDGSSKSDDLVKHNPELKTSEKVHKILNTFKCHVCFKELGTKSTLKSHLRIHTGEKPYKCNQCGKAFQAKYSLTEHQRAHNKEKPFICSICQRSYSRNRCLKAHVKKIHSNSIVATNDVYFD